MAFCAKCGAEIEDNVKFCSSCGAAVNSDSQQTVEAEVVNDFGIDEQDINENKGISVLSYLGILFLIPLLVKKDSKYVKFHVNQGLVLFIIDIAITILDGVFKPLGVAGSVLSGLTGIAGLAVFILMIMGIVNAATGKVKELPIIGSIRILK